MHRWLNTPHVSEWWELDGKHHPSLEEVKGKYYPRILRQDHVDCFIFSIDRTPAGMIQYCNMTEDLPEQNIFRLEGKYGGIDIFIGEEDYVHKGLGNGIILAFLKEIAFRKHDIDYCMVDPEPINTIAVKAYRKAGFKYLKSVWYEPEKKKEDVYIIRREEVA